MYSKRSLLHCSVISVVIISSAIMFTTSAAAQTYSDILSWRREVSKKLNQKIQEYLNATPRPTTQCFDLSAPNINFVCPGGSGLLKCDASSLSCDTNGCTSTLPVILQYDSVNKTVKLRVKLSNSGIITTYPDSHTLVSNLNEYWNAAWGAPIEIDDVVDEVMTYFSSCASTNKIVLLTYDQLYGLLSTANKDLMNVFIEYLEDNLMNTTYSIRGLTKKGKDFIHLYKSDSDIPAGASSNPYPAKFILDRENQKLYYIPPAMELHSPESPGCPDTMSHWLVLETSPCSNVCMGLGVGGSTLIYIRYWQGDFVDRNADPGSYYHDHFKFINAAASNCNEQILKTYTDQKFRDIGCEFKVGSTTGKLDLFAGAFVDYLRDSSGTDHISDTADYTFPWICLIDSTYDEQWCEAVYCLDSIVVDTTITSLKPFDIDPKSGNIIYTEHPNGSCAGQQSPQTIYCIRFCGDFPKPVPHQYTCFDPVIKATAQTYSDQMGWDPNLSPVAQFHSGQLVLTYRTDEYERGELGKWRLKEDYVYKENIIGGSGLASSDERIYRNAGVFVNKLRFFEWRNPEVNVPYVSSSNNYYTRWIKTNTITKYSISGEPLQERNILGIYSSAQFGYGFRLPVAVAHNGEYETIQFTSFEYGRQYPTYVDFSPAYAPLTDTLAHSGRYSMTVPNDASTYPILCFRLTSRSRDNAGLLVNLWVRRLSTDTDHQPPHDTDRANGSVRVTLGVAGSSAAVDSLPYFVAKTGKWWLYQLRINPASLTSFTNLSDAIQLRLGWNTLVESSSAQVWVDDVRLQPYDAQMNCYVYDQDNLRLLTSFDDQHFGVYYQYNAEGKLVRKLRETERGMRTVQETQYATPGVYRDPGSEETPSTREGGGIGTLNSISDKGRANDGDGNRISGELFNLELGVNKRNMRILGQDSAQLARIKKFFELPDWKNIKIPEAEKLKLMSELSELNTKTDSLDAKLKEKTSDEQKKQLERLRAELANTRRELLAKAGLSEDDAKELLKQYEELKSSINREEK